MFKKIILAPTLIIIILNLALTVYFLAYIFGTSNWHLYKYIYVSLVVLMALLFVGIRKAMTKKYTNFTLKFVSFLKSGEYKLLENVLLVLTSVSVSFILATYLLSLSFDTQQLFASDEMLSPYNIYNLIVNNFLIVIFYLVLYLIWLLIIVTPMVMIEKGGTGRVDSSHSHSYIAIATMVFFFLNLFPQVQDIINQLKLFVTTNNVSSNILLYLFGGSLLMSNLYNLFSFKRSNT
jgi:hypothetical protein